jgi:hypothetical protein
MEIFLTVHTQLIQRYEWIVFKQYMHKDISKQYKHRYEQYIKVMNVFVFEQYIHGYGCNFFNSSYMRINRFF